MRTLAHVLWIGGGTGAGKTSAASAIAERHGAQVYHYDYHDARDHSERIDPARHPAMRRWASLTLDQRWVHTTPEQLATLAVQVSRERLHMVLEDLSALPADVPIIAEGFGFSPDLIAPLLPDAHHAVWLLPTEAFRVRALAARGWSAPDGTSDPSRARSNKLQRDARLTALTRETALARGLRTIDVDESRPLADVVAEIEQHFADVLHGYDERRIPVDRARDERLRRAITADFPRFLSACTRGHSVLERVARRYGVEAYRLGLLHSAYLATGRSVVTEDLLIRANPASRHSRIGPEHWAPLVDAGFARRDGAGWLLTDRGVDALRDLYRELRAEVARRAVPPALAGRVGEVLERMSYLVPPSPRAAFIRELWGEDGGTTLVRLYRAVWELYAVGEADAYAALWPSGSVLDALERDFDALLEAVEAGVAFTYASRERAARSGSPARPR